MIIYVPASALVIAGVLAALRGRVVRILATVVVVAVCGDNVARSRHIVNPLDIAWREAAQIVSSKSTAGDLVLVGSGLTEMLMVPVYKYDRVFHDYVCCRLGRMYMIPKEQNEEPMRASLPRFWLPEGEMEKFNNDLMQATCRGKLGPNPADSSATGSA